MKAKAKFEVDYFHFKKGDLAGLKKFLEDHKFEVLKMEEHENDDFSDVYSCAVYYCNDYYECGMTDLQDNWYILIDILGQIEAHCENSFKECYEIINE